LGNFGYKNNLREKIPGLKAPKFPVPPSPPSLKEEVNLSPWGK